MKIELHIHNHTNEGLVLQKLDIIMATLQELQAEVAGLKTKVTGLQEAIDNDQASDASVVETLTQSNADLKAQIVVLEEQIASGATPEALAEVVTGLKEIGSSVDAAIADVSGTV